MHVLIVDDDIELCDLLKTLLEQEGFSVTTCHDGAQGLALATSGCHDFLVLDVMLPGCNGFDLLRQLRRVLTTPILMLTARGNAVDRIVGLEIGADDYLPKPFHSRELVARIRAIQRRHALGLNRPQSSSRKLVAGDILLDLGTRTIFRDAIEVPLTAAEFSLLHTLILHVGEVVSRKQLAQEGLGRRLELFDRSIDVHISSLRRKLGPEPCGTERIKSVRSVGYLYIST